VIAAGGKKQIEWAIEDFHPMHAQDVKLEQGGKCQCTDRETSPFIKGEGIREGKDLLLCLSRARSVPDLEEGKSGITLSLKNIFRGREGRSRNKGGTGK